MHTLREAPATLADRQATANLRANLAALGEQAEPFNELAGEARALWAPDTSFEPEWVFARDGTLTAISHDQQWWSGCSVPTRAARLLLDALSVTGKCGCLLAPAHPAVARVAIDKLKPEQVLLVVLPTATDAAVFFRCDDFSAEIRRRRLWIVWGDDWPSRLQRLYRLRPGLPIPTQFIKPRRADASIVDDMLPVAQQAFVEIARGRSAAVEAARAAPRMPSRPPRRILALAGSRFRLWDEAGMELLRALSDSSEFETTQYDTDDPLASTPLSLLLAARDCDAIVAADTFRADCAGVLPTELPVVTWMTRPRVAAYSSAGPADRLLVADPQFEKLAVAAGWPTGHIYRAGWPRRVAELPPPTGPALLLFADLLPLTPPDNLQDISSHRLLWEMLADRMARDPLAAYDRAEALVHESAQMLGIDPASVAVARYVDELIVPAFAQGIARLLIQQGLPVRLIGQGWDGSPVFAPCHAGTVRSRRHLMELIADSTAIVHSLPASHAHPVDALGRPVVRYRGGGRDGFLRDAAAAAAGRARRENLNNGFALTGEILRATLHAG